ncbi:MAG: hypothetical protein GY797_39375, partial [Deltaproteobacteria bacterium]|nr:hypothetical protein [Deltaproteobacteria bacterium]
MSSSDVVVGTCPIVITRTYTVSDECGNNSADIIHTIHVDDTTLPTYTGSLTTTTIEGCVVGDAPAAVVTVAALEALTGDLLVSDNCSVDGAMSVSSSDVVVGTCPIVITRTYTVTDECGNNSADIIHTINVDDTTVPTFTGSITLTTIEGCVVGDAPAAVVTVAALESLTGDLLVSDNCSADGSMSVSSSDVVVGTCPIVITRTYTVSDECGNNSADIIHTINVDDTTLPTYTGSLTTTTIEGCVVGDAPAAVVTVAALEALTGDLLVSDNCSADGDMTVSSSDVVVGTCPIVITRTYTVTDECGNNSADIIHTINVDDTTVP